jgi:hypothetical protein
VSFHIPLGLRTALESGNCVLFVGAGVGTHLADQHGHAAPNGTELAKELALAFDVLNVDEPALAKLSQPS